MTGPRLLVIGATGPTGLEVLRAATASHISVRALARNPETLTESGVPVAEVVRGNVLAPETLAAAVQGITAVISVLGSRSLGQTRLLSDGTRNLVAAMSHAGVARLVCVTGMGAGDSRGHGGFLYDRLLLPLVLRRVYADKDRQEQVIHGSGLDWVIARPAFLTNGNRTGSYRELTSLAASDRMTKIARADVADFLIREAAQPQHHHCTVNLTY